MMQAEDRKKRLCIVPVCHGERFDLVHKFPTDNKRAEKWRKLLDIPFLATLSLDTIRKRYFVCSRHFKISDYKNIESRGLNKTAEPSKNIKILNDFDIIDHKVPNEALRFGEMHDVEPPTEFMKDENVGPHLNLESVDEPECVQKIMADSTRKRKFQTRGENVTVKRVTMKNSANEKEDDNFLAVMTPALKDFDGQLVFHINHMERPVDENRDSKEMFILPVEQCSDVVEVIDLDYGSSDEPDGTLEVDESHIEQVEDDDANYVGIDEVNKNHVEENDDNIIDLCLNDANGKEDEDENEIGETLDFLHPDYPETLRFHHFWLRDHCRCSSCYSAETFQRKFNIMDIPIDIKVRDCTIEGKELTIEWSDNHKSIYDLDTLCRSKYENYRKQMIDNDPTVLWDKNVINDAEYARVNFSDYLANDEISKSVVRSLVKYGVAFIEKVPPNVQSTEIAIRNLFPIHRTFFGEMFTVLTDFKEFQDSAYSKEFLPAHTDNTYFPEASGLQILHVTQHNGTGGETILVDGFKAATELKRKYPEAFERLLYTNVPAEYLEDGQNHYDCSPLIKQNTITGELEQIRFNLYDRAPLHSIPHEDIMQYYKDFRLLANEIQSPQNEWWFKLNPGTVMIFNNWRVLHGRAQYTGKRSLAGSYVSRTDFMSKVRCLGILDS